MQTQKLLNSQNWRKVFKPITEFENRKRNVRNVFATGYFVIQPLRATFRKFDFEKMAYLTRQAPIVSTEVKPEPINFLHKDLAKRIEKSVQQTNKRIGAALWEKPYRELGYRNLVEEWKNLKPAIVEEDPYNATWSILIADLTKEPWEPRNSTVIPFSKEDNREMNELVFGKIPQVKSEFFVAVDPSSQNTVCVFKKGDVSLSYEYPKTRNTQKEYFKLVEAFLERCYRQTKLEPMTGNISVHDQSLDDFITVQKDNYVKACQDLEKYFLTAPLENNNFTVYGKEK